MWGERGKRNRKQTPDLSSHEKLPIHTCNVPLHPQRQHVWGRALIGVLWEVWMMLGRFEFLLGFPKGVPPSPALQRGHLEWFKVVLSPNPSGPPAFGEV